MVTGGHDGPVAPSSRQVIGLSFLGDVSPRGIVASMTPDPMPSAPRPLNGEPRVLVLALRGPSPCCVFVSVPPPPLSLFRFLTAVAAHQQRGYTWEVACSSVFHSSPSGCTHVPVDFYLGDQSPSRVTHCTELPGSVVRDELERAGPRRPG